jgi:hypothetical protein
VKNYGDRLYCIRGHIDSRPIDERIAIPHTRREFATNQLCKVNTVPSIEARRPCVIANASLWAS